MSSYFEKSGTYQNDLNWFISKASATSPKGIYSLDVLVIESTVDIFSRVLGYFMRGARAMHETQDSNYSAVSRAAK
eukprot:scaffold6397_cov103-Cylindrotheca_fusiformis.AAC.2